MTQTDKNLLLKDLCARLPYGVKGIRTYRPKETITLGEIIPRCKTNPNVGNVTFCELGFDETLDCCVITEFKPYLFPLSSVTEEMLEELNANGLFKYRDTIANISHLESKNGTSEEIYTYIDIESISVLIEFFHSHHIDYRGLIEKGLAIDATGLNIY